MRTRGAPDALAVHEACARAGSAAAPAAEGASALPAHAAHARVACAPARGLTDARLRMFCSDLRRRSGEGRQQRSSALGAPSRGRLFLWYACHEFIGPKDGRGAGGGRCLVPAAPKRRQSLRPARPPRLLRGWIQGRAQGLGGSVCLCVRALSD